MSDGAGATAVELDVMVAGELSMPRAYAFRPERGGVLGNLPAVLRARGDSLRAPLLAFAVRHPAVGPILIDTGLHPAARQSLRREFGPLMTQVFRGLRPAEQAFDEQLRGLGIEPGEVKFAVMTHLHVDHTGGMRLLPQAEFVCAREEWAAATARSGVLNGYVARHLPPASRVRFVDFDRDGEARGPFSRTVDLLGDGSVRLVSTPGHTRGHLSVLLRLPAEREVLLIGDAAYTLRSVREQILPLLTADDETYLRSLRELEAYAARRPDATLVPFHDPTAWHDLGERAVRAQP